MEADRPAAAEPEGGAPAAGPGDEVVGRVLGTEDATPLEFWVAIGEGRSLQLDDVVALERTPPGRDRVKMYGVVSQVRARHVGARYDTDVFLISDGVLPAEVSESALVQTTRVEPEVFVPPLPGSEVRRAEGKERDEALFFDGMAKRLPAGLTRDDEPLFVNLEFLDGTRGAHVNISGISGVATKTTYATFLLYSLFTSGVLGAEALNTKALIFNVKGEDLLFLDRPNTALDESERARYAKAGLVAGAFPSVSFFAAPKPGSPIAAPDVASRDQGVTSYFWTLQELCHDELLRFLFADAEDERQHYGMVVSNVEARLKEAVALPDGGVLIEGREVRTFRDLVHLVVDKVTSEIDDERVHWAGRAIGQGTINAFVRRFIAAIRPLERLIRGDVSDAERHRIALERQVTVVDLHSLPDRAKRFVVGVTIRRAFEDKERSGQARPLLFLVLDELNKYAPRDGSSPIKEVLLDVAERGRSLGIILVGAQQTASEVERRIVANSAIRVVGRLDTAEAGRDEYGFLPTVQRQRATIIKPGTMLLSQPELPIPLVVQFPFPAWATRPSEAGPAPAGSGRGSTDGPDGGADDDPFAGLP